MLRPRVTDCARARPWPQAYWSAAPYEPDTGCAPGACCSGESLPWRPSVVREVVLELPVTLWSLARVFSREAGLGSLMTRTLSSSPRTAALR